MELERVVVMLLLKAFASVSGHFFIIYSSQGVGHLPKRKGTHCSGV